MGGDGLVCGYFEGQLALCCVSTVLHCMESTDAGPLGRRGDQVGGFIFQHQSDLRKMAPLWLKFSEDVRADPDVSQGRTVIALGLNSVVCSLMVENLTGHLVGEATQGGLRPPYPCPVLHGRVRQARTRRKKSTRLPSWQTGRGTNFKTKFRKSHLNTQYAADAIWLEKV